jgi:chromosome segregation ATPase
VSKQASHKTAYEHALAIANQAIANLESATENNESTIQEFLASYSTTSGDILDLQTKSRDIRTKGPALQDQLVQAQRLHTATATEVDDTALYVKSAIVIGLLIVVGIVGIA